MGNINMCQYASTCCDKSVLTPQQTISQRITEIQNDIQKNISFISEPKPDNKFKNSFNAYDNFCLILKNVLKIQRVYRKHKNKKSIKNKYPISIENNSIPSFRNNNINTGSLTKTSTKKLNVDDNTIEEIKTLPKEEEHNNKLINKEDTISNKQGENRRSVTNTIQNIQYQSATSFFSHYSSVSNSVQNSLIIQNSYSPHILNPKDINGNFTIKPRKGLKFKGTVSPKTHKKNGFGIVRWEDGSKFLAIFENNHAQGICRYHNTANKSVYIGTYENNTPKGYGIFQSQQSQVSYEGIWTQKELNGIGIEIWSDETYYQGEFLESTKNGVGLYRWPDGTIYQGEWKKNSMTGYGIILFNDDKAYAGEMLNGLMNGYGEFSWKNGNFYAGYYQNDKKSGFGIFIWSRKPLMAYIGFWSKGKQHGVGINVNVDEVTYCLYKEGKKNSQFQEYWEMAKFIRNDQLKYENILKKDVKSILAIFQIKC